MLKVRNLHKTFNSGSVNEKVAITGVDLNLERGEFITVIGGNGAGKSTLLNLIAGVYPANKGEIILDKANIAGYAEHQRALHIGRVFQDPLMGTAASMTIEENLAMAMRRGLKRRLKSGISHHDREFFREQLTQLGLGLEHRLATKVGLLSGGQRQALTLLMATITKPKLLLLDEHTAALDPKTAKKVLALTDEIISKFSLTTLMVTHNMNDALHHGNRTIMMHEGRVILDIGTEEKERLSVEDLLHLFEKTSGSTLANDRMLLTN